MPTFKFFDEDETLRFSCNLKCQRCEAISRNGLRCNNRTCKSLPYCHIHLKYYYGLVIKPSIFPEYGYGLFTLRRIDKNTLICEYLGEEVTEDEIDKRYGEDNTAPYAMYVTNTNEYLDSACKRGIASWVNHTDDPKKANAYVDRDGDLISKRTIYPGEEIFIDYGGQYLFDQNTTWYTTPYDKTSLRY